MSNVRPYSRSLSRLRRAGVLALALSSLTCRDANPFAPGLPSQASLAVAPQLQRAAASGGPSFLPLQKVVGILTPVGGGSGYTVVAPFVRDTAVLTFDVTFAGASQRYTLALAATDTAGDTLFKSLTDVVASAGSNQPVHNVLQYVAPDTAVRFLSVALSDTALLGGDSLAVTAIGYDSFERRVTPLYIGWTSRDTALAKISSRGPSIAQVFGGTTESAVWLVGRAFNGATDSVLVPVRLKVASVVLNADSLRLATGEFATLNADVRSATGASLDRPVVWTSLDQSIATVAAVIGAGGQSLSNGAVALALGQVFGVSAGTTRIVATSGGKADTTVVVVAPIPVASIVISPDTLALLLGQMTRFSAVPRDAQGNALSGRTISWTSSDALVASVATDGSVNGVGIGVATITATSEGVSASATVRVEQAAASIARTVISPPTVQLSALGQAMQLTARSYAPDSTLVAGSYSYSVHGSPSIVSVDSLGRVTAIGVGSAYVVVRETGGTSDSALVSVTQVAKRVQVSAPRQLDALGMTSTFHATAFDAGGSVIPAAPLNWTISNAAVGVIDLAGGDSLVVRAVGNGVTPIVATVDGITGSSDLTVSQVAKSASVSPNALTLGVDGRARLTLTLFDANRAPMSFGPAEVKWQGGQGVVEVDTVGEVHAKQFGTSGIFADVRGIRSDTSRITVSDAAPSAISFSADTLSIGPDGAPVSVYLSLASTLPVTVVLSDPLGLVKFSRDTLLFDKGLTRNDVVITGLRDGRTTIDASDVARLFAPDSMTLFVGKTGVAAAFRSLTSSVPTITKAPAIRRSNPQSAAGRRKSP